MELLTLAASILLIALTFFLLRRSSSDATLPPGSFGWPILGESVEFLFGKPEKFVGDRMRKYSPDIFKTKILGEKTAVICGPTGHKFLFSNEQKLFTAFRPHPMQHLFRSYKPKSAAAVPPPAALLPSKDNDETKAIRQPGFLKPEALMRYLAGMDLITQKQLHIHCHGKKVVEFYPLSKTITLTIACQFFLGINNPERIARFVKNFDDVTVGMHCIMLNLPGTIFYRGNKAAAALRKELIAVIKEKKEAMAKGGPLHDILSHMIVASDPSGKSMPEPEIADKMMGLLTAGYSTVATTMTFLMKYLGLNPDIYERVRAEQLAIAAAKKEGVPLDWEDMAKMKYSWNVICETMRMVPPLQGTFREVIEEFTYAGYTIPKGWKVYWTVSTTSMNPQYFKDPERFNPSRYDEGEAPPPYTYVPFGGGLRMCPGKEYARISILAFVHNVVKKYRWEVVDPNEKVEGDMMPEPQKGLPVRLYQH
ncbi:beta-amyrin 28-monooxygenase-like [Salvia splendens]|uniref:beta-amyrin 28-monooxygenase-like n=1 Tax=Salvia splendens TaxID=180675 RepID=UPI001C255962|nr:beta-amyrin 28-monooxygenase-like [Salvia splendens]